MLSQLQNLAHALVNFHTVVISSTLIYQDPCAIPLLRKSTGPPNLVWSASLLRMDLNPASRLSTKTLKRTWPKIEPWGTLLMSMVTLSPDVAPFTITLGAWLISQLFTHYIVYLSRYILDILSRKMWQRVPKALPDSSKITSTGFPWSTRWVTSL